MQKIAIGLIAIISLSGCISPILKNNYMETTKEVPPEKYLGAWTGTIGNYLSTFKINPDGSGLICNSWHTHNSVERIKYNKDAIHPQSGGSLNIKFDGDKLIGKSPTFISDTYIFLKDNDLKEAAPYCIDKI